MKRSAATDINKIFHMIVDRTITFESIPRKPKLYILKVWQIVLSKNTHDKDSLKHRAAIF